MFQDYPPSSRYPPPVGNSIIVPPELIRPQVQAQDWPHGLAQVGYDRQPHTSDRRNMEIPSRNDASIGQMHVQGYGNLPDGQSHHPQQPYQYTHVPVHPQVQPPLPIQPLPGYPAPDAKNQYPIQSSVEQTQSFSYPVSQPIPFNSSTPLAIPIHSASGASSSYNPSLSTIPIAPARTEKEDPNPASTAAIAKKVRTQFSACQACRNRRVKCDLKDVVEEWESLIPLDPSETVPGDTGKGGGKKFPAGSDFKYGPSVPPSEHGITHLGQQNGEMRERGVIPTTNKSKTGLTRNRKMRDIRGLQREHLACTNCYNRGTSCVDEYRDRRRGGLNGKGEDGGELDEEKERKKDGRFHPFQHNGEGGKDSNTRIEMNARLPAHGLGHRVGDQVSYKTNHRYTVDNTRSINNVPLLTTSTGIPLDSTQAVGNGMGHSMQAVVQNLYGQAEVRTITSTGRPLGLFNPQATVPPPVIAHAKSQGSSSSTQPSRRPGLQARVVSMTGSTYESEDGFISPAEVRPDPLAYQNGSLPNVRQDTQPTSKVGVNFTHGNDDPTRNLSPMMPSASGPASNRFAARRTSSILAESHTGKAIPDLKKEFLSSAFYRRWHIQRPICDPTDFARRYLAHDPPRAHHMGHEGSLMCHILYAWACSYGVDEAGALDVPERNWPGGILPAENGYVWDHDQVRDRDRLKRRAKTDGVVANILKEIDDAGIMRRHSWDGVRCLLLILPLTEYVSTPMERLAMYECAVAQVFALCSLSSMGYDGLQHFPGPDGDIVRVRLYWYTFVHEGITSGLKGGRLVLDEDDLDTFNATLPQGWALVSKSTAYKQAAKLATAPIRLAIACRLIHRALTGPKARRQERVNRKLMDEAWEALECCWEEFEAIRNETSGTFLQKDDIIRFADGWRIFMFEAHNVIRESLEHRCAHLIPRPEGAFLTDLSLSAEESDPRTQIHREIHALRDIARAKCDQLTRLIVDIVKMHINTTFFEWDASLVRDGTYYAAMLLAKENGTEEDVAACLQALNEMRWAYAKTGERSNKLRDLWAERQAKMTFSTYSANSFDGSNYSSDPSPPANMLPPAHSLMTAISGLGPNISGLMSEGALSDTASINQGTATDFVGDVADAAGAGAYPTTAALPPSLDYSPPPVNGSSSSPMQATQEPNWITDLSEGGRGLFYPPTGAGERVANPLRTPPLANMQNGGLAYVAPGAGIHLIGQPQKGYYGNPKVQEMQYVTDDRGYPRASWQQL